MTTAAFTIHDILTNEEGIDASDPIYYSELDKRIRNEFPHKFNDGGEAATKAESATNSCTSRQKSKALVRKRASKTY